jgi:hypothetical protein
MSTSFFSEGALAFGADLAAGFDSLAAGFDFAADLEAGLGEAAAGLAFFEAGAGESLFR